MPARNQAMIRRDINRLNETIQRNKDQHSQLAAIETITAAAATTVNNSWQVYQQTAVQGDKEREERESALTPLTDWIQSWRPVLMLVVPGADKNIHNLPPTGATPDDLIRVAEDMVKLIETNSGAESFRDEALSTLGENLDVARNETADATAALAEEAAARQAYADACQVANNIIVRGSEIVRAIFGRTSPEYKQFIARAKPEEEQQIDEETNTGECEPAS